MKNLLKKVNGLGLALILVCGVVLTTQSAFKSSNLAEARWGFYTGSDPELNTNTWYNYDEPAPEGFEYVCSGITEEKCTSVYDGDPNTNGVLVGEDTETGVFDIVPEN